MKKLWATHKVLWMFLLVVYLGATLCGYLWVQNRYDVLATQKAGRVREVSALRGEVVLSELENRELASLDRISSVAHLLGLEYAQVPCKVKQTEGK